MTVLLFITLRHFVNYDKFKKTCLQSLDTLNKLSLTLRTTADSCYLHKYERKTEGFWPDTGNIPCPHAWQSNLQVVHILYLILFSLFNASLSKPIDTPFCLQHGVSSCSAMVCDCESPTVNLQCCPQCQPSSQCMHQSTGVIYEDKESWVYECQVCRCAVSYFLS